MDTNLSLKQSVIPRNVPANPIEGRGHVSINAIIISGKIVGIPHAKSQLLCLNTKEYFPYNFQTYCTSKACFLLLERSSSSPQKRRGFHMHCLSLSGKKKQGYFSYNFRLITHISSSLFRSNYWYSACKDQPIS